MWKAESVERVAWGEDAVSLLRDCGIQGQVKQRGIVPQ